MSCDSIACDVKLSNVYTYCWCDVCRVAADASLALFLVSLVFLLTGTLLIIVWCRTKPKAESDEEEKEAAVPKDNVSFEPPLLLPSP